MNTNSENDDSDIFESGKKRHKYKMHTPELKKKVVEYAIQHSEREAADLY